jgi:cell filamentation protein, protein adenylyltransferase
MPIDDKPRMDPRLARRLEEKKAELDGYRPLSAATVRYINEQLRVLLTYHSNAIEGNTLSLRETMLVIEHGITVGGHSLREHLEAINHAQAFAYLTELISQRALITREVILTLNRLVVDKLIDNPGQFRSGPVTIRGARIQPPLAAQVPKLMREWVAWIMGEGRSYPTVLRAAIAHHGFEAVHPFRDGNGRTGRLLMNLILMQDGYPPALLLQEWRLAYLEALAVADTGRYGPLANLIGRAVEQGLDLYLEACEHAPVPEEEGEQLLADLAREFGYTTDYLGLLIRKGRLAGTKRGPYWYSTRAAIERYRREVQQGDIPRGRPRGRSKR